MKKKGSVIFQFIFIPILCLSFFGTGIMAGINVFSNIKTSNIKDECVVIDHSLELWSAAHRSVKEETINYSEQGVKYAQQRTYPKSLSELGIVQKTGYFSNTIDLSKYQYYVSSDGTKYKLGVNLPDGTFYQSLGSNL